MHSCSESKQIPLTRLTKLLLDFLSFQSRWSDLTFTIPTWYNEKYYNSILKISEKQRTVILSWEVKDKTAMSQLLPWETFQVAVHKGNPGIVRQSFCGFIIYVEAYYLASTAKGQERKSVCCCMILILYVKQYNISYK